MTKKTLVSVIIPNYNHARYLDKRLQSVLGQTYTNFEVIILDDKSTDNSLEVIAKYQDNPHVSQVVVNEVNSGSTFKQWDKGISLAKGEIIWIAESDDWCELNLLYELVKEWNKHENISIARCNYVYVDDYGNCRKSKEHNARCYKGINYIKNRFSRSCYFRNASGVIFSRAYALKVSKQYITFKSTGDYMFWVEMAEYGDVIELNKNLSYYRIHTNSVTSNNLTKGITSMEDKVVFDYICSKYPLCRWQKRMALASHRVTYQCMAYDSSSIKDNIFKEWGITNYESKVDKWLMWFVGAMERHLGILI